MATQITVIGAGPGGYVAAVRAAQLGAEVTIIENDNVGGTCLNWGCIPSKILKVTADLMASFGRAKEFGLAVEGTVRLDMTALNTRKEKVIGDQIRGIEELLRHHKIRHLKGTGRIAGPGRTTVEVKDGDPVDVAWDRLILATGSRPAALPTLPFDGKKIISSNEALYLDAIPDRTVIVGGGVIGCEFAFILSALGSRVTVVEALSRALPLPAVDEACSKLLQREMKKRKITFLSGRIVDSAREKEGALEIAVAPSPFVDTPPRKSGPEVLTADTLLVCVGRTPNIDRLGLEILGVKTDEKGWILANERLETEISGVYAIGDILGPSKAMLAHVASAEGIVAAENAMGAARRIDYGIIPAGTFTMPEVANVGLSEKEARERSDAVRADTVLFRSIGKAQVLGELAGEAKIVSDGETGKILGIHLVGPHATDLIAEGTLAIQLGATVGELADTVHAHPTLAEILMEAAFKATDRALHG